MGKILRLDDRGHGPVAKWDPKNKAEVRAAERVFKQHTALVPNGKGELVPLYTMFDVSDPNKLGTQLESLDPEATEILAVPQIVGG
jgi:hypothetical protein